mmetsp:Transcript_44383/g.117290  ORF Transcript_44383/g.117290 Transcript_44383/m.117290 type:complete len:724 (-) Transcript_44383:78-2249(-)
MGEREKARSYVAFDEFPAARPESPPRHSASLVALTCGIVDTFHSCNPDYDYVRSSAPRRVLTKPEEGVWNSCHDNANFDYICRVNDVIMSPEGEQYIIEERQGHGTFGQVLKCSTSGGRPVAVKIIKNKPAYFQQALVEVRILQQLNSKYDPQDQHRVVRMIDYFVFRKHLCIVFELLSVNIYELLKQNKLRGLRVELIRVLTEQLLLAMDCLRQARIIHCDLKPENVLFCCYKDTRIKLIDFGSACFEGYPVHTYIQSRFYRSPEVLLGLPYNLAIDMWSLGCICAELYLGLPIFPGSSEFDQLHRIVEVLGVPPENLVVAGKNFRKFFVAEDEVGEDGASRRRYRLKTREEYGRERRKAEATSKRYFSFRTLPEMVKQEGRSSKPLSPREANRRQCFLHFLQGVLAYDPEQRWTPKQALAHPFIRDTQFDPDFVPPEDPLPAEEAGQEDDLSTTPLKIRLPDEVDGESWRPRVADLPDAFFKRGRRPSSRTGKPPSPSLSDGSTRDSPQSKGQSPGSAAQSPPYSSGHTKTIPKRASRKHTSGSPWTLPDPDGSPFGTGKKGPRGNSPLSQFSTCSSDLSEDQGRLSNMGLWGEGTPGTDNDAYPHTHGSVARSESESGTPNGGTPRQPGTGPQRDPGPVQSESSLQSVLKNITTKSQQISASMSTSQPDSFRRSTGMNSSGPVMAAAGPSSVPTPYQFTPTTRPGPRPASGDSGRWYQGR